MTRFVCLFCLIYCISFLVKSEPFQLNERLFLTSGGKITAAFATQKFTNKQGKAKDFLLQGAGYGYISFYQGLEGEFQKNYLKFNIGGSFDYSIDYIPKPNDIEIIYGMQYGEIGVGYRQNAAGKAHLPALKTGIDLLSLDGECITFYS